MKFNIDDYKGKYAMHCKTEAEARDFLNYMYNIDANNWRSYLDDTRYCKYSQYTIYNLNNGLYGHINSFIRANYTILEWSDFMNKEFTKADLRTGDVILRRNGDVEIVNRELGMLICSNGGWNDLTDIKEDLTSIHNRREFDIVEVRRPKEKRDCCFAAMGINRRGTLVYERKEVEEMTLAEVCRLLGKEIKIVK